jgi:hypothetical protein
VKLLNTLLLLARPSPPTTGVAPGAIYYDTASATPLYYDGSAWTPFVTTGVPQTINSTFMVPDNRQVMYFDSLRNDGVLFISGTGTLVGMR